MTIAKSAGPGGVAPANDFRNSARVSALMWRPEDWSIPPTVFRLALQWVIPSPSE
jgi:hypothetical protein